METIFINRENSKTSEPLRFRLDLKDKLNLKHPKENMALVYLSIYYTWESIKSGYRNNKFKIFAPTWNDILIYHMVLFNSWHSRLGLIYHQKTWNFDWNSTCSNLSK